VHAPRYVVSVRRRSIAFALATALAVACAGPASSSPAPPTRSALASSAPSAPASATPTSTQTPRPTPTAPPPPHVFVIVMENAGLGRALASAPIKALAARFILATSYHAVARPSLPNYLAMTSGSTWGITDDAYHALPDTGIGRQLTDAGIPWRAYMEGLTAGGCLSSPYPYAVKHDPFAYYGGGCPANVVPFEALETDLSGEVPRFVWITPGLCHDGHDCPLAEAGAWLEALVLRIVASPAWRERSVLFITWDEGDGGDENLVPLIVATPNGARGEIGDTYDHYSLLATIEDLFSLPRLGAAAGARSLADLLPAGR
jgi:hypothetical protein